MYAHHSLLEKITTFLVFFTDILFLKDNRGLEGGAGWHESWRYLWIFYHQVFPLMIGSLNNIKLCLKFLFSTLFVLHFV